MSKIRSKNFWLVVLAVFLVSIPTYFVVQHYRNTETIPVVGEITDHQWIPAHMEHYTVNVSTSNGGTRIENRTRWVPDKFYLLVNACHEQIDKTSGCETKKVKVQKQVYLNTKDGGPWSVKVRVRKQQGAIGGPGGGWN